MLEVGRLNMEIKLTVGDGPALWQAGTHLPLTASGAAAVILSIGFLPKSRFLGNWPYNLRVRAAKRVLPPALQLVPISRIYYFIINPLVCYIHIWLNPSLTLILYYNKCHR